MPHANGDETLGELADRMIRECAMWRERAMRLEMTAAEREAIEGMAAYFDTRGNITLQAWGSLLRVLLMRWK